MLKMSVDCYSGGIPCGDFLGFFLGWWRRGWVVVFGVAGGGVLGGVVVGGGVAGWHLRVVGWEARGRGLVCFYV